CIVRLSAKCVQISPSGEGYPMPSSWWLASLLAMPLQVPPPTSGPDVAREVEALRRLSLELESSRRSIVAREDAELRGLAKQLELGGDSAGARSVLERIPPAAQPDGATRFVRLHGLVKQRAPADREGWRVHADQIQSQTAQQLLELAARAAREK